MSMENSGNILEPTILRPKALLNIAILLTDKLRQVNPTHLTFYKFHPIYLTFDTALLSMINRIGDIIESYSWYHLLFTVGLTFMK